MSMKIFGEEGAAIEQKWARHLDESYGAFRGTHAFQKRRVMAQLLETTNNLANGKRGQLFEDVTAAINPNDNKMILPVIRKAMAGLIAFDLATVQPLTAPTGQAFVQTLVANRTRGSVTAGTDLLAAGGWSNKWYSSEYVSEEPIETGDGAQKTFTGSLQKAPLQAYNATKGYSVVITDGTEEFVDNGSGVLSGDAGGSGTIDYVTGEFSVTFNAAPTSGDSIVATYTQKMEGSSDVGELTLGYTTINLTTKERRIKFNMSLNTIEDMMAQLGISAEAELVSYMAKTVAFEIDREVVQAQIDAAQTTATYSYSPASASVELDTIRHLMTKITNIAAEIGRKTNMGAANYIVTSPKVVALLNQLSTHQNYRNMFLPERAGSIDPLERTDPASLDGYSGRVSRVGTLDNKFIVYQDSTLSSGEAAQTVLIGLRGQDYFASGTVYAPYVPVSFSTTMEDVDHASIKKAIRTRYALKVTRPEFYGTLTVTGLETF